MATKADPITFHAHNTALSFEDTSVAFSSRSYLQLKKSHVLFTLMNNPLVVDMGSFLLNIALKLHLPVSGLVRATIFEQFCGGENIEECSGTIKTLSRYGVGAILDYSVEGEDDEASFEHTKEEIIRTIEFAHNSNHIPFCVFKPTGIARFDLLVKIHAGIELNETEKEEFDRVYGRFRDICQKAFDLNVPILVDAEETWIQKPIDKLVYEMMERFNKTRAIVYNTFQMYRKSALDDLKRAFHYAATHHYYLGAKLVRGAYMEKEGARAREKNYPNPIFETKKGTDDAYNAALKYCIDNKQRIAIINGSHNEYSNYYLTVLMDKHGMKRNDDRVFFAQLYGMSDNISFNLAKEGFNVVKYVPYGPVKSVIPYLMRRAEENTSIAGQTSRELTLIRKELQRRRKA